MTEDQGMTAADEMDPLGLNLDLNDVDTSMPVISEGLYVLTVDKIEIVENKSKTGNNLLVIYKTTGPTTSLKGQLEGKELDIAAGFQLRQYMPLQQNPDKPDARDYTENLANLQDAVTGSKKGTRGKFMPSTYIGRQVAAKVKVQDDPDYGKGNSIARLSAVPQ